MKALLYTMIRQLNNEKSNLRKNPLVGEQVYLIVCCLNAEQGF